MGVKSVTFFVLLQFINLCRLSISSEVPAILWNIKGESLKLKPITAFGNDKKDFENSLQDVLQKSSGLLVFAVNSLSLEDFSRGDKVSSSNSTIESVETFLNQRPHMLLSSVKDPLNLIHKAHCDVEEIIVDQGIDDNVLQSVASALERSCAVILHVSDVSIIPKYTKSTTENVRDVFLPSFKNLKKNLVGMFSGMKSSWDIAANEHHSFRNLLQAGQDESHFSNYSGCIIAYSETATLIYNSSIELKYPPSLDGSECSNTSATLQMKFSGNTDVTSATIKFTFVKKGSSWVSNVTELTLEGSKVPSGQVKLKSEKIDAPIGYSYSCGTLELKNTTQKIILKLTRFQVQPYEVKGKFADSFDCTTFFTIPIWSGIFVAILFITIINFGVYALFSVNTMDRFDDPKGKTISVAAATD